MAKAKKQTTTTTPAPHPSDPANNDQRLVALAHAVVANEIMACDFQTRGEALKRLSQRIFPGRFNDGAELPNGWERQQAEMDKAAEDALATITATPADTVAGLCIKLRLLERDTEFWQTADCMIDLFYSALDDAERLVRSAS
jgi:hypothetical protein